MTRNGRNLDHLAAKRIWNIDALSASKGDAVSEMADVVDHETFSHGAHR